MSDTELVFKESNESVYCGKKNTVPFGYSKKGSRDECFKSGLGVGFVKSKNELRRDKTTNDIRVLTNLEILRLSNRLGIRTVGRIVNRKAEMRPRVELLEKILERLGEMKDFITSIPNDSESDDDFAPV